MIVEELLERAAVAAEAKPTCRKAVNRAWAELHTEGVVLMAQAFTLWCQAEDFGSHASGLSAVLNRSLQDACRHRGVAAARCGVLAS